MSMPNKFPLFKSANDKLVAKAGLSEIVEDLKAKLKDLSDSDVIKTIKDLPSDIYDKLFKDDAPEKPGTPVKTEPVTEQIKAKKYIQKVVSEANKTRPDGKVVSVTKLETIPGSQGEDDEIYARILSGIGAPVTPENKKFFYAWRAAEGGTAAFNPFNTTKSSEGATNYNSIGVKNYVDGAHGADATIKTLLNSRYSGIVNALRGGGPGASHEAALALSKSPWGTGDGALRVLKGGPQRKPIYRLPEDEENID
jgi:hypothetical protein